MKIAMRTRVIALALVLSMLVPTLAHAQRGGGKGGAGKGGAKSEGPSQRAQEEGPDSIGKYGLHNIEVLQAVNDGDGPAALAVYEKGAAEAEKNGSLGTAARAGAAAVLVASKLGMLQKVLTLGPHVMELAGKAMPSQEVSKAMVNTSVILANAHRAVNERAKARTVLETALAYSRAAARQYRRAMVGPLSGVLERLSSMEVERGDHVNALAHAREAVQLIEGALGERARERGRSAQWRQATHAYLQVARVTIANKQPDLAAAALSKAAEFARLAGLAELAAEVALQSAHFALQRDDAAEALRLATAARADAEKAGLSSKLGDADRLLAQANARLGNVDAALAAAQSALARIENSRASLQDPALRAGFLEQRQGLYSFAVHLALRVNRPDEALALAERSRSRAFLDLLGNASLSRTRALAQEESAMRARLAEAATIAQESDEEEDSASSAASAKAARDRIASAERDYQAFLQRVRKENVEQASLMTVDPVTVTEIQALVPQDAVLVEYLLSDGDLIIWVVDRTTVQVRRPRMDRGALVAEVREFRAAIASQAPLPQVEARAQALYQKILGPVRQLIRGKRLVIVPHDVLHYLPFAALRTPEGKWLMEEHAVGTVPSASVLKFLVHKGANADHRVLAVGNPDLGPGLALRYAEREVQAINERFPSTTTMLTRAAASESRVKQQLGQAGLLHFAVHGELNEDDPMASALLLTPGGGEDGRLEVREVFATELSARLVVLSACETGLGKLSRGDELVGLQRAFLYAGTPAVVTTLWKVDDRASFRLMRAFYEGLASKGPTEALRAAQRALLADFPHPFAWAAFGLTGAPR